MKSVSWNSDDITDQILVPVENARKLSKLTI